MGGDNETGGDGGLGTRQGTGHGVWLRSTRSRRRMSWGLSLAVIHPPPHLRRIWARWSKSPGCRGKLPPFQCAHWSIRSRPTQTATAGRCCGEGALGLAIFQSRWMDSIRLNQKSNQRELFERRSVRPNPRCWLSLTVGSHSVLALTHCWLTSLDLIGDRWT